MAVTVSPREGNTYAVYCGCSINGEAARRSPTCNCFYRRIALNMGEPTASGALLASRRTALTHPATEQRRAILGPRLVARHRAVGEPLQNLCGAILHTLIVIEIEPESEHVVLILVAQPRLDVA